jgi:predicted dienelactone hydrolase
MRWIALLVALWWLGSAAAAEPLYKVGMARREVVPTGPYDWRQDPKHWLATRIWYPAPPSAQEKPWLIGPPDRPFLDGGRVARDAALAPAPGKFPLILLSHGTGGTSGNMAWLGEALAAHGYIAAAVNHPGNNFADGYTVPGFTLWWLRARDLSAVLDGLFADPTFGPRIDKARIGAAGHSLGGYTALTLAGAITSLDRLAEICRADGCADPAFPDIRARAEALRRSDPAYRAAQAESGRSYRDPRVRAVFAMAPALGPVLLPDSLAHIDIPVALVAAIGDKIVPASSIKALAAAISHAQLTMLPPPIGHNVFIGVCLAAAHADFPRVCDDPPGVDRAAVEAKTADMALAFFAGSLR